MGMSSEADLSEIAEIFWDEMVERLVETDPRCADLFDEMAPHNLYLAITWNCEDGALTGTLRCRRCLAAAAWMLTCTRSATPARKTRLTADGSGDRDLDAWWKLREHRIPEELLRLKQNE